MRSMIENIQNNEHLCMLADKGTENSNVELRSLVLRQAKEGLEVKEYFVGFHRLSSMCIDQAAHLIKARFF